MGMARRVSGVMQIRASLCKSTHTFPDAQRDAVDRLERFLMFPNVPKLLTEGNVEQAGQAVNA